MRAYLPDGTPIDYEEYLQHPHWEELRKLRFAFDGGKCVACHADLYGKTFQAHHITYQRCGHEMITDVITLCEKCHSIFHENFQRANYWEGKEEQHWDYYDLHHTAEICKRYFEEDKLICRNPDALNLCNLPTINKLIDRYTKECNLPRTPIVKPTDIQLFVRNKRYELLFAAQAAGHTKEEFLNSLYGEKIRGKNPIRVMASSFFNKHTDESYRRHYSENEDINILMREVEKLMEDK